MPKVLMRCSLVVFGGETKRQMLDVVVVGASTNTQFGRPPEENVVDMIVIIHKYHAHYHHKHFVATSHTAKGLGQQNEQTQNPSHVHVEGYLDMSAMNIVSGL